MTPDNYDKRSSRTDTPRYYRVSPRFWKDEKVRQWSDDTKLLALHLLTSPHRTPEGIFVLPVAYLVADLNWRQRKIDKCCKVLIESGFLSFDLRSNVFLIRQALKYQVPENPNQTKAVMRRVRELPETPLLKEFLVLAKAYCYRRGAGADAQGFAVLLEQQLAERVPQSLTLNSSSNSTSNRQTLTLPPTPPAALGEEGVISHGESSEARSEERLPLHLRHVRTLQSKCSNNCS